MITAKIKVKIKSNYMSKKDFDDLKMYSPKSWQGTSYEEYCNKMSDREPLVDEHFETKKMAINTDDIEIAKFHLSKVEGLVEILEITT